MSTAYFLLIGNLKYFLRSGLEDQAIAVHFQGRQSIKHLVESLGVPHTEIGQVCVNEREASLAVITQDNDQIEVHPIRDGSTVEPRFLLDGRLGRLAAYLRMLGFDCLYRTTTMKNWESPKDNRPSWDAVC
jgi:hypothetical protein